jgi:preprotein translocase subunit SecG
VQILSGILNSLLILSSLFLICLVLIQRGKGGGLAGAFGGMGGSSAFGTKAGDIFTRVTMVTALVWILLNMILVVLYNRGTVSAWDEGTPRTSASRAKEVPPTPGGGTGKASAPAPAAAESKPKSAGDAAAPTAPATPPAPSTPSAPVNVPAIPEK